MDTAGMGAVAGTGGGAETGAGTGAVCAAPSVCGAAGLGGKPESTGFGADGSGAFAPQLTQNFLLAGKTAPQEAHIISAIHLSSSCEDNRKACVILLLKKRKINSDGYYYGVHTRMNAFA